jgi:hypothetical protein
MASRLLAILCFGLCFVDGHLFSGADPAAGTSFLDLPDGFGASEEEEDEPELIEFYSEEYEGDAWFFCLDRSSSMGRTTASGEVKFSVLKRETVRSLTSMTKRSVVSVVFYNKDMQPLTFGDPPVRMDGSGKARMIASVTGTPISAGSCMIRGMLKTLDIAHRAQNNYRQIMLTADGRTHCPNGENNPDRVYQNIISKNSLRIPINTIYTGPQSGDDWTIGKPMLERLSRATNGKFKIAQ